MPYFPQKLTVGMVCLPQKQLLSGSTLGVELFTVLKRMTERLAYLLIDYV
ncbi:hypothetical protein PMI18_02661 [Pseudomonas sp. GM102]|nr:hypothetical protein PMI18_02661 [Pseudomonas sp. GM102]